MAMLTQVLLLFLGMLLMIVVLLQRGRGGGLAGAFGGAGGQSAFGTKAGDVFTRITVVIAVAWVLVAGGSGYFLRAGAESRSAGLPDGGIVPADADQTPVGDAAEGENQFDFSTEDLDGLKSEAPTDGEPATEELPTTEEPAATEGPPVESPEEESTEATEGQDAEGEADAPSDDAPTAETPADGGDEAANSEQ